MATIQADIPNALQFLFEPHRYKVAYGGRGSAKSWGFARALLIQSLQGKHRILCARELQKSISESVHNLLKTQIELLGLQSYFEVLKASIVAKPTGSEFIFMGLRNDPSQVKSTEGLTRVWVEEAAKVSEESWETLIPTLRAPGSEIWVTFNPEEEDDPTYKRFVKRPPPEAKIARLNWHDNPWFPDVLRKEMEYCYSVDPAVADHVWGGQTRRMTDAQVLRGRYVIEAFEPRLEVWDGPYQGADWGFAVDPSVLVRVWTHERKLYVEHEAYGLQVETDHLPALFDAIPEARKYVTRADNARPETISYMVRQGWNKMMGCQKWKGCVEDRAEHMRAYDQVVIHPRCTHTAEEARLWSFKVNRGGDVLPELEDKFNHCMDAIGYALEPLLLGQKRIFPRVEPESNEMFFATAAGWMR